jgi:hypothetical protein
MALIDPNFDGALSVEELEGVMASIYDAVELKRLALLAAQNPFYRELAVDDVSVVRIFGLKAFIESLLKIGIGYMSFHGTPEQSELPTQAKVVWMMTFVNWQFSLHRKNKLKRKEWRGGQAQVGPRRSFGCEMADMVRRGFKPGDADAEDFVRSFSRHESGRPSGPVVIPTPLQSLLSTKKKLFDEPDTPPVFDGVSLERSDACSFCKHMPHKGWGRASCSKCGCGDAIIRACLASDERDTMPVLDTIVTLYGTSTSNGGDSPSQSQSLSFKQNSKP